MCVGCILTVLEGLRGSLFVSGFRVVGSSNAVASSGEWSHGRADGKNEEPGSRIVAWPREPHKDTASCSALSRGKFAKGKCWGMTLNRRFHFPLVFDSAKKGSGTQGRVRGR